MRRALHTRRCGAILLFVFIQGKSLPLDYSRFVEAENNHAETGIYISRSCTPTSLSDTCSQLELLTTPLGDSLTLFTEKICSFRENSIVVYPLNIAGINEGSTFFWSYQLLSWSIENLLALSSERFPTQSYADSDIWLEFGVAEGDSIKLTATIQAKISSDPIHIFGFDWFNGLPEVWENTLEQGHFSNNGNPPQDLPDNVYIVKGLFNQTLNAFLHQLEPQRARIGFVNIDCDLYSSALYVLKGIITYMRKGSIMHFHEFMRYPSETDGCRGHDELRALYSLLQEDKSTDGIKLEILPYKGGNTEAVIFRVL